MTTDFLPPNRKVISEALEDGLMDLTREPMLMGQPHEHRLMGQAHWHVLMGRAHGLAVKR